MIYKFQGYWIVKRELTEGYDVYTKRRRTIEIDNYLVETRGPDGWYRYRDPSCYS